jgi:hypothetical protein
MEYHKFLDKFSEEAFFPSYETIRSDFKKMLEYHNINKVNIISHSFGTIILGILIRDNILSKKIDKKVLVDPVCFIDRSFKIFKYINEPCNTQNSIINPIFNVLVYNDLYVRYISQRFLYGPEFWIFDYEKLSKSLVVLSTEDSMVPSMSIYNRCKQHQIPCFIINNAYHGDIFLLDEFRGVWEMIKNYLIYCQ